MNKGLYLSLLFIVLLLLQVLVLDNILLYGYINPYIYIVFVFVFPINKNRVPVLTYSFLLGLCMDFFTDSGGANAFATLSIAYVRFYLFKRIFQKSESKYKLFTLSSEPFGEVFNYTVILTFIHHFILFSLINFSFNNFFHVLTNTLFSSIFTLFLYFSGSYIFRRKQ